MLASCTVKEAGRASCSPVGAHKHHGSLSAMSMWLPHFPGKADLGSGSSFRAQMWGVFLGPEDLWALCLH